MTLTAQNQGSRRQNWINAKAKNVFRRRLENIKGGSITLVEEGETTIFGHSPPDEGGLSATVYINNGDFYSSVAFGGSLGAGEAYVSGQWQCNDLVSLVRLMISNRDVLESLDDKVSSMTQWRRRFLHWLNRNTTSRSRKNIKAHYDLGNEFFKLFLDESMTYSCGFFEDESSTLAQAQEAKLRIICSKLQLNKHDRIVEIGSGWGGFAIYAAKNYGCHVTTTTISDEQYAHVKKRIVEEELTNNIALLKRDYRDMEGEFDKLVSVEMIEAVGSQFLDTYLKKCSSLLKPDGVMLLQAITIQDQRYDRALKSVDFIQKYIFPGGFIPSVTAVVESARRVSDLRLFDLEDIGPHYARTLMQWKNSFFNRLEEVKSLGYADEFVRMWDFYLSYSAGGFMERALSDAHFLFVKPDNRIVFQRL
ncbi:MAG: class I SAM-dependent methyltransferase [Cellvibrionales bacterium TMED148]|nr:SAM-dependent methyltransferase [Porticoccaceae bacterium]RPG89132.1 MAG: class I SAM-dependent methyltransferase [Cellvibrionales bacterium TMED148]